MPKQTEDEEISRALTELARILRRVEETLNYMAAQLSTDDETEELRAEDAPPHSPSHQTGEVRLPSHRHSHPLRMTG